MIVLPETGITTHKIYALLRNESLYIMGWTYDLKYRALGQGIDAAEPYVSLPERLLNYRLNHIRISVSCDWGLKEVVFVRDGR
jgi:hypothetical protein